MKKIYVFCTKFTGRFGKDAVKMGMVLLQNLQILDKMTVSSN